jgi:hypothetical protein
MSTPVILSYGLGVDSTAILLRWIVDPTSRDFDLADLTVVTAMTGDEWEQTGADVEAHVLPLMREHGIRYVQVGRNGRSVAQDGIATLDDSTQPERVHLRGVYRLSDEMREAGTIPQTGGARLCSVHAKGDVLDPTIEQLTAGRPFRHVIGFEAGEPRRAAKDATYNTATRTGEYPLIEWGWDRARCIEFIREVTGIEWQKSACTYCPFALAHKAGLAATLTRYAETPDAGADTLVMEHIALALNPAQGLIGGKRAIDAVRQAGHVEVLAEFQSRLDASEHAVYEVRRVLRAKAGDPTRMSNASRSVRRLSTGTRADALAELDALAAAHGWTVETGADGITRAWIETRGPVFPTREAFLVVAPATVHDKEQPNFEAWWADHAPEHQPAAPAPALTLF